ncbi:MAG: FAD-dependent oxidoreductase [Rhodoferax sp.]|nr:FAD-dependent oxidoreductase [Rhodoferax sp.]
MDGAFFWLGHPVVFRPGETFAAAMRRAGLYDLGSAMGTLRGRYFCGIGACQACLLSVNGAAPVEACLTPARSGVQVTLAAPPALRCIVLQADVLVVGGGPAGVAAAVDLAGMGWRVLLAEQRDRLGGAVHRAYAGVGTSPIKRNSRHERRWQGLLDQVPQVGDRLTLHLQSVLLGVDSEGSYLLDDRRAARVRSVRPKAVVMAVGGVERVLPVPGWELPGVITAGGMQVAAQGNR